MINKGCDYPRIDFLSGFPKALHVTTSIPGEDQFASLVLLAHALSDSYPENLLATPCAGYLHFGESPPPVELCENYRPWISTLDSWHLKRNLKVPVCCLFTFEHLRYLYRKCSTLCAHLTLCVSISQHYGYQFDVI